MRAAVPACCCRVQSLLAAVAAHPSLVYAAAAACLGPATQVDGLRAADHSPGVLLLDAVSERLDALPPSRVDGEVVAAIRQSLAALGREDAHPVSSGGREPPPPLDRGGEASYT